MKSSRQLLEQRNEVATKQQQLHDAAKAEKRDVFNESEQTQFDNLQEEYRTLTKQVETAQINEERAAQEAASRGNDLSKKEKRSLVNVSIADTIRGLASGKPVEGVLREMQQEAVKENENFTDDPARGIVLPSWMLRKEFIENLREEVRADQTAGTDSTGGYTVQTDVLDILPALRQPMQVETMGARVLRNLTSDIQVPAQLSIASAEWEGETDENAQSDSTYDTRTLTPHRVGVVSVPSKQLVLQSNSDIIRFITEDQRMAMEEKIEIAMINGSGTGDEPEGILNVTGLGDVAGGANGLVPTWAHILELESDVATAKGERGANLAYLTTPGIRGAMKAIEKATNTAQFLWDGSEVNGRPAYISNHVPSDLVKGSSTDCHAIIYGDWTGLVIGYFGGIELLVNPWTQAKKHKYEIITNQFVDFYVAHAGQFSAMQDALTS